MRVVKGVFWGSLCLGFLLIAGCAGVDSSQGGASGLDLTTQSDEPDVRKRARLRIELASGYFEQGQTTIALDEIKQALVSDPNYAPAYGLRGLVYMRLAETRLAEESFRKALQINSRDANVAHNLGWLLCQQGKYADALILFSQALANPNYGGKARTLMTQGICQARAGQPTDAEQSLTRSLELDSSNPVTAYNLARMLYQRGAYMQAQLHLRRLNNGELANAETLWLGIKAENRLGNRIAERQLGDQLKRRYPQSRELGLYERGAFDE